MCRCSGRSDVPWCSPMMCTLPHQGAHCHAMPCQPRSREAWRVGVAEDGRSGHEGGARRGADSPRPAQREPLQHCRGLLSQHARDAVGRHVLRRESCARWGQEQIRAWAAWAAWAVWAACGDMGGVWRHVAACGDVGDDSQGPSPPLPLKHEWAAPSLPSPW
jgi:hypothetical protein